MTDVWQFLDPTFQAAGTLDVARSAWQEMNGAVTDAADQFHLTGQGQSRLIAMVLELGFAPLG